MVLGLLFGGVLGNFIDWLVCELGFGCGYVVDFIVYWYLFIGNVVDIVIVGVVVLVLVFGVCGMIFDGGCV